MRTGYLKKFITILHISLITFYFKDSTNAMSEKQNTEFKEVVEEFVNITPQQIQARFDTLRHLSDEDMAALNKKLVRKIDWRLMPCVTLMFLMKCLCQKASFYRSSTKLRSAILIVLTCPTLDSLVCKKTYT